MKQCSPIVLFLILLLLSCNRNKTNLDKKSAVADSINLEITNSQRFGSQTERIASSDNALKLAKRSRTDSFVYKALYNKIQTDIQFQRQDSIDFYLEELKKVSTTLSYQAGYHYLNGTYLKDIDAEKSFSQYEKSRKLYGEVGDKERMGYSLMMMSEIQREAADYVGAETTMTEALSHLKNSKVYHNHIYNVFGLIYKELYDFENAIRYYKKALENTAGTDTLARNIITNNIATIYLDKEDYGSSIRVLDSLNNLPSLNSDPMIKAKVLSNLGYSIFKANKGNGIAYLKQAEKIQDSISDSFGKLFNYANLSEAYLFKNKALSKEYGLKSYHLATRLHNGDDRLRALELLLKSSASKQESDTLFKTYVLLNDSINAGRQTAKNQFSKIRYDSSEKEKELLQSKAESAESKLLASKTLRRNEMLVVAVLFLIALTFFSYRFMKKKNAKGRKEEAYVTETRISKKVHDELANDIYNAMIFAEAQELSLPEKKERLLNDLEKVYKRTRDISKENAVIETGEQYYEQLIGMLSEYNSKKINVINSGARDIDWRKIEDIKKIAIYRILQELMVNMRKHSQATLCLLNFKKNGKNIEIFYSDNGIGMGNNGLIFKSGLANAENRMNGIGGKFTFEPNPEKGLKITIVFPA